tara:strand:- start:1031 stop:3880 length:2850 start_codon:yes stop_codon:yes gene_type:complete
MGVVVNSNTASMFAGIYLNRANSKVKESMSHISSGLRINTSSDDAAGIQISKQLESQIRGIGIGLRNGEDALSIAQVAESALQEGTTILSRIYELSLQAANGSNGEEERLALHREVEELKTEITRIADTTVFGSQKLLNGYFGTQAFQVGANGFENIFLDVGDASASAIGMHYHQVTQSEFKVVGHNNVVALKDEPLTPFLDIQVDDLKYGIELNYAMTATELKTKINNVQGLSLVEVDLLKGTGTENAQLMNGLDKVDFFQPKTLRVEDFVAPTGVVGQNEEGVLYVYFTHEDGTEHQAKLSINPLIDTRDKFRAALVQAINDANFRGIEATMNETDWNVTIAYTGSAQFPQPPEIDFAYFNVQNPGIPPLGVAAPPPTFELKLDDAQFNRSSYEVINHATTVRSGDFQFVKGDPLGLSSQASTRSSVKIELDNVVATSQAGNELQLKFSIVDDMGDAYVLPALTVDLDAAAGGSLVTHPAFRTAVENALTRDELSKWYETELIDDVFLNVEDTTPQGGLSQSTVQLTVYFNKEVKDPFFQNKNFHLQTEVIVIGDNAVDTQLEFNLSVDDEVRHRAASTQTVGNIFDGVFAQEEVVGQIQADSTPLFGEQAARIKAEVPTVGQPDEEGRFHILIYDDQGELLFSEATESYATDNTVNNFGSPVFIMDRIAHEVLNTPTFTALYQDTGINMNYETGDDYIDFFYEAKDEQAPPQLDIRMQYEVMGVSNANPPVLPITSYNPSFHVFYDINKDEEKQNVFTFNAAQRPENKIGEVQIGDLYGLEEGTSVFTLLDDSLAPPAFKPPEFIVNFNKARQLASVDLIQFKQDNKNINRHIQYNKQVMLMSVAELDVTTFEGTQDALYVTRQAMDLIVGMRSALGAKQNRMVSTGLNNENIRVSIAESRSRIIDLDFAAESTRLAQHQILQETGAAMLTQANQVMQIALTLLQG